MIRIRNWDVALHRWARSIDGTPFVWGETDCASLAISALEVMYPRSPAIPASWTSETAALRLMAGHPGILEEGLALVGAEWIAPAFASIGDILLLPETPLPHLYVHLGAEALGSAPAIGVHRGALGPLLADPRLLCFRIPSG